MAAITNQLENGTAGIDDTVVATDKVWSSSKTQAQIQLIPKGDKGDKGDPGTASVAIDDTKTNTTQTWSSQKIQNSINNVVIGASGKNMFDKNRANTTGYLSTSNGTTLITDAATFASDFMSVLGNTAYVASSSVFWIFYKDDKTFISSTASTKTVTTPSNAAYARVDFTASGINTLQIELGAVSTSYEAFKVVMDGANIKDGTIANNSIKDGTLTKSKFQNGYISLADTNFGTTGKNLFNKAKAVLNAYIDVAGGKNVISPDNSMSYSEYIPVTGSTQYILTYSSFVLYYDSSKNYLGYVSSKTFTTPANAAYVILDFNTVNLNTLQMELGTISTIYEDYKYTINPSVLPVVAKEYIVVSKTGKGDYTSISQAVNYAQDGAVILVMPGQYEENVACGSKNVSIIGVDRQKCVLWNSTGNYDTPPLYISKGHVKNMTIKSVYDSTKDYTGITTKAYAVHIDNFGSNGELLIEDCDLISDFNNTFGCGAANNHKLTLRNCTVIATNKSGLVQYATAFAYHGSVAGTVATVILDNNRFSGAYKDIDFQSDGASNTININAYFNVASKVLSPYAGTVYILSSDSYGNQSSLLNK
jgi:hypothetical protein